MAKTKKIKSVRSHASQKQVFGKNIRFIVPMPGKSSWHSPSTHMSFKKLHRFSEQSGDYALEDFQAQFLMQREYLID